MLYRAEQAVRFLTADPLGQVYVVTPDNQLIQYNVTGAITYRYQNFRHGALGWVDAGNPLNILLFYPEFGQIIILDRTLSEIARLNLPEMGFWDVPAVGRSADNQIWLYDPVQTLIRKINLQGMVLVEGQPLSLLLPEPPDPVWITERDQEIYLYDPEKGALVFDPFGQYLKTVPTNGVEFLGTRNGWWPLQNFPGELPEAALSGVFQSGRLVLQTGTGFAVYTY